MAELRPKIVKLCKIIGGFSGVMNKIDENAPEYYCMASILTDDEADIAIAAGLRKERTAEYLAKKTGKAWQRPRNWPSIWRGSVCSVLPPIPPTARIVSSCRSLPRVSWRCW